MISKSEFERLTPKERGYVVYMSGCRSGQPHVPAEDNPYPVATVAHDEWEAGQRLAIIECQDCP